MESRNNGDNPYYEEQPKSPVIIVGEQNPEEHKKNSNTSVTSLVLGILSLVFVCIPYISIVLAVTGLIFGMISVAQHRDGKNMAIAGIITSGIGVVLSLLTGFLWILLILAS